jgi:hypothetical protein
MFPENKAAEMASAIYRSMLVISSATGVDMSEEGLKVWRFFTTVLSKR